MLDTKYKNLSVVIVEDDKDSAKQIAEVFKIYFDNVYISYNGCEGLELIEKYIPDIVISDIDMPCLDGIEMIEHLQSLEKYENIMYILITAYPTSENLLKTINTTDVDAIFSKPVNLKEMLNKIKELLEVKNKNIDLKEC